MVKSSPIKNRREHPINKKTSCGNYIGPKLFRDVHLEQKVSDSLKKMFIISLSYPILRGCINHVVTLRTEKVLTNIAWHYLWEIM